MATFIQLSHGNFMGCWSVATSPNRLPCYVITWAFTATAPKTIIRPFCKRDLTEGRRTWLICPCWRRWGRWRCVRTARQSPEPCGRWTWPGPATVYTGTLWKHVKKTKTDDLLITLTTHFWFFCPLAQNELITISAKKEFPRQKNCEQANSWNLWTVFQTQKICMQQRGFFFFFNLI